MAKFRYTAVTEEDKEVTGTTSASTGARARAMLAEKNLDVIDLREKKGVLQFEITKKKVPPAEIMHFSRQLAAFVRAGVPILEAIQIISEEVGNTKLREILTDVRDSLKAGRTLSDAITPYRDVFPRFYVDMIRSAELTGHLDNVLDQISRYMERDLEARQKIRSALAYPLVIFVLSIVTIAILAAFVLPRFKTFFESLNADLPLTTRMLLAVTDFLGEWWWLILGVLLAIVLIILLGLKTEKGKNLKDRFLLRLPVIGEVVRFAVIERFCRIFSAMVQAGVPLPEAMEVVAEGTGNSVYEKGLVDVREQMLQGEGISRPLSSTTLFPSSVVQMVRVGEETGTLDQQLETAASYYEQELSYKIKKLTTLFEPAVIIFMGVVVGFVAVSVVSAMYGVFRQIG